MRSVTDLPPLPQVVIKAHEIMADTGSTFKELGDVIETDQAIAGRVLKLANSAYYGLRGMVSSIHQASVVLGFEALGELITVVGAAGLLDSILKGYRLESGSLWQHSLVVAFGSRMIARKKDPKMENSAFSAGLLHDAGKIVLNEYVLEKEDEFDSFLKVEGRTFLEAEKQILGFDHAEISSDLCRKWSLPELQCSAIRYHHYPSKSGGNMLAGIIHISDMLAVRSGAGTGFDSMLYEMETEAFEQVGLSTNELEEVITKTLESVDKISDQIHK
jgi:HD-like signal output (HDOD) protein